MKRISVILFLIITLAILIAWSFTDMKLIRKGLSDFPPEISKCRTLITGDSHTQTAIDPAMLDDAVSLSYSNENLFFTYYKIKWALERGEGIERIILGFSYNNLTDVQEDVIMNRTFFLEHYYLLLDSEGKRIVAEKSQNLLNYFTMKYKFGLPLNFYNNDLMLVNFSADKSEFRTKIWGGYKRMETANINEAEKEKMISEAETRDYAESELMAEYLEKIISLCSTKGVKLYLVNTPMHELFYGRYSKATRESFKIKVSELLNDERIAYLDMQRTVSAESLFYDGEHLNAEGAGVFTPIIDSIIGEAEKDAI